MNLGSSSQLRIGFAHRVAHPPPEFKDGAQLWFDSSLSSSLRETGKGLSKCTRQEESCSFFASLLLIIVGQSDPSTASSMALLHLSCSDQREVMNQCPNVRHRLQSFLGLLLRGTFRIVFLRKGFLWGCCVPHTEGCSSLRLVSSAIFDVPKSFDMIGTIACLVFLTLLIDNYNFMRWHD